MPDEAEYGGRVRRSVHLDPDMAAWLAARARALSTSEATIVRQVIRAAMNAEQHGQDDEAAA